MFYIHAWLRSSLFFSFSIVIKWFDCLISWKSNLLYFQTGVKDEVECEEGACTAPKLVRVTYFPQRRGPWVNLCLILTALLVLGTGTIAAIFLYRHLSNKVVCDDVCFFYHIKQPSNSSFPVCIEWTYWNSIATLIFLAIIYILSLGLIKLQSFMLQLITFTISFYIAFPSTKSKRKLSWLSMHLFKCLKFSWKGG